jgi:acyl dehydratase
MRALFGWLLIAAWGGLIYLAGGWPPTVVFLGGWGIIFFVAVLIAGDELSGR